MLLLKKWLINSVVGTGDQEESPTMFGCSFSKGMNKMHCTLVSWWMLGLVWTTKDKNKNNRRKEEHDEELVQMSDGSPPRSDNFLCKGMVSLGTTEWVHVCFLEDATTITVACEELHHIALFLLSPSMKKAVRLTEPPFKKWKHMLKLL